MTIFKNMTFLQMNSFSNPEEVLNVSEGKSRPLPFFVTSVTSTLWPQSVVSAAHRSSVDVFSQSVRVEDHLLSPCRRWTWGGFGSMLWGLSGRSSSTSVNPTIWLNPNLSAFDGGIGPFALYRRFLFTFTPADQRSNKVWQIPESCLARWMHCINSCNRSVTWNHFSNMFHNKFCIFCSAPINNHISQFSQAAGLLQLE